MSQLPVEICEKIIRYIPIGNINTVLDVINKDIEIERRKKIVSERLDPCKHLGRVFKNPKELMYIMKHVRAILVGSNVVEYFSPGVATPQSDWDFIVVSDTVGVAIFMTYLSTIGVVWEKYKQQAPRHYERELRSVKGLLTNSKGTHKINILCANDRIVGASAFGPVVKFHSSIVQCFISGFSAHSLYHALTSRYMSLRWITDDKNNGFEVLSTESNVATIKYEERGIKYISYETYITDFRSLMYPEILEFERFNPVDIRHMDRNLSDRESHVVTFNFLEGEEPKISTIDSMRHFSPEWYDVPYMTMNSRIRGSHGITYSLDAYAAVMRIMGTLPNYAEVVDLIIQEKYRCIHDEDSEINIDIRIANRLYQLLPDRIYAIIVEFVLQIRRNIYSII